MTSREENPPFSCSAGERMLMAHFVVKTILSSLPAPAGLHDFHHYVRLSSLALIIPRTFAVSLLARRRPEQKKLFKRIDAKSP
jgi:hypothetical protein